MTPEELERLVKRGDGMAVAAVLEDFGEAERRKLSKAAAALWREIKKYWDGQSRAQLLARARKRR